MASYSTHEELEAGLSTVRQSPRNGGLVKMIVRRPQVDAREVLDACPLDRVEGLMGDSWKTRGGIPNPEKQLTIMNSRVIDLIAKHEERWPLAGDQLFIDLDLSSANLPPGTQISIGNAAVEISAQPHKGCKKFLARFGPDALKFVNSEMGLRLNLRGINAKVIQSGVVRVGDSVTKKAQPTTSE